MMLTPLRVLIVEDSEVDAELIRYHLGKAGFELTWECVETAGEMRAALEGRTWDIIISDYNLPGFSAPAALTILQQSQLDIPFIVDSGTISEETALDLMRAGAADYLMKDRLARLGALVRRELNISQVRRERTEGQIALQASQMLVKEEELYLRTILQTTTEGFWMLDSQGKVLEANQAYCQMSGYALQELKQLSIHDLDAVEDCAFIQARIKMIQASGSERFETRHKRKNGSIFDVEISVTYLSEYGGRIICFCRDISERKRNESQLIRRMNALTRPLERLEGIDFKDLFDLKAIQNLQDEFSAATGVASIITSPDGTPITRPSNFCQLCSDIIRKTEIGQMNCFKSDAAIGRTHLNGPVIQHCMSAGLWDAGAGISVGGRHIANWLIGQVRDASQTEEQMRAYARQIGADETEFLEAFYAVPAMSQEKLRQLGQLLFTLANQLSETTFQNVQQARFINERKQAEERNRESGAALRF